MTRISYEFHGLEQMAGDIRNRAVALSETHDELKRFVQGLLENSWDQGGASEGYQASQAKWDAGHAELLDVLERIAKTVEDGAIDMKDAEVRNAASWG